MELTQPHSALSPGKAIRAVVYRILRLPPAEADALRLWQIGGLLKHDMIDPDAEAQAEASAILTARTEAVRKRQQRA